MEPRSRILNALKHKKKSVTVISNGLFMGNIAWAIDLGAVPTSGNLCIATFSVDDSVFPWDVFNGWTQQASLNSGSTGDNYSASKVAVPGDPRYPEFQAGSNIGSADGAMGGWQFLGAPTVTWGSGICTGGGGTFYTPTIVSDALSYVIIFTSCEGAAVTGWSPAGFSQWGYYRGSWVGVMTGAMNQPFSMTYTGTPTNGNMVYLYAVVNWGM